MVKIIYAPDPHKCPDALGDAARMSFDTVVECDCGKLYRVADSQKDGHYWERAYNLPEEVK